MDCDTCDKPLSAHDANERCPDYPHSRFKFYRRDHPTCPHCGAEDQDWWDGTGLKYDGDEETRECGECEREYSVTMCVTTEFNCSPVDREWEAKEAEGAKRRLADHRSWQQQLDDAAGRMPPGTRIRDKNGSDGVIANEERKPGSYVAVQYPGRSYTTLVDPTELEVLG